MNRGRLSGSAHHSRTRHKATVQFPALWPRSANRAARGETFETARQEVHRFCHPRWVQMKWRPEAPSFNYNSNHGALHGRGLLITRAAERVNPESERWRNYHTQIRLLFWSGREHALDNPLITLSAKRGKGECATLYTILISKATKLSSCFHSKHFT